MTGTAETPQSLFFLTEQSVLSAGGCTLPEATLPSLSLQVAHPGRVPSARPVTEAPGEEV